MPRPGDEPPRIDSYRFGHICVDGRSYSADLLLLPGRVRARWWREEGHSLSVADLDEVFREEPEVLVVGTGAHGAMDVPEATRDAVARAGIRLLAAPTAEAVEHYNRLRLASRTAAALHLTC